MPYSLWKLNSLTRYGAQALGSENTKSPNHGTDREFPVNDSFNVRKSIFEVIKSLHMTF